MMFDYATSAASGVKVILTQKHGTQPPRARWHPIDDDIWNSFVQAAGSVGLEV